MTGIFDKFYIEHDIHGARVMVHSHQLTPGCISDTEIDKNIQRLKNDLDACASEMKRIVKAERGSLFERGPENA